MLTQNFVKMQNKFLFSVCTSETLQADIRENNSQVLFGVKTTQSDHFNNAFCTSQGSVLTLIDGIGQIRKFYANFPHNSAY